MGFVDYAVYAINMTYAVKDSVVFLCQAVYDAYCTKTWVFTTRNVYPVLLNSTWTVDSSVVLQYSPDTHTFLDSTPESQSLDIVTAEIETANKNTFDMSSFLYSIRWHGVAPSLYELVILFFLHEKICLSTDLIDTYKLTVLTSDAEERVIPLGSAIAKKPFHGWNTELKVD
jgi:hypothetical protein